MDLVCVQAALKDEGEILASDGLSGVKICFISDFCFDAMLSKASSSDSADRSIRNPPWWAGPC